MEESPRRVAPRKEALPMLPPKRRGTLKRGFNITLNEATLVALDEIVEAEGVKSRNALIDSFLAFAAELFHRQKPFAKQVQELKQKEAERTGREVKDISDAEVHVLLLERGLKAAKK